MHSNLVCSWQGNHDFLKKGEAGSDAGLIVVHLIGM